MPGPLLALHFVHSPLNKYASEFYREPGLSPLDPHSDVKHKVMAFPLGGGGDTEARGPRREVEQNVVGDFGARACGLTSAGSVSAPLPHPHYLCLGLPYLSHWTGSPGSLGFIQASFACCKSHLDELYGPHLLTEATFHLPLSREEQDFIG